MPTWSRYLLYALGAVMLLLGALAAGWVISFDGERFQRAAAEWMRTQHARELSFDAPAALQLWPQPAVALRGVRLSEAGRPEQAFAEIEQVSLSLHLRPLLMKREIEVDRIGARGLRLAFERDADGRRNIDDLLAAASGDARSRGTGSVWSVDVIEVSDAELRVADASAGVHGRIVLEKLSLGRFGAALTAPLRLQGRADLQEPALTGTLVLETGIEWHVPPAADAAPVLRLKKTDLRVQGEGFHFEKLDARLQAHAIRVKQGSAAGTKGRPIELDELKLQFSGSRLGWHVDTGRLDLAHLQLDVAERRLRLDKLMMTAQGHRDATKLDARLVWPSLEVVGDRLQGGPVDGRLQLDGDRQLQLTMHSKAPSGVFERITLAHWIVDARGRLGTSALKAQAEATLTIEPVPLTAAFEALSMTLQMDAPGLPPLDLALRGSAKIAPQGATATFQGQLNNQRLEARAELSFRPRRNFYDIDARFATLDLNRFITPGRQGAAPAAAAAPLDLQALHWADASVRVSAERLLRPPYRVDGLELQADVDNGVLTLRRAAGRAWGGHFDASGRAEADGNRLALRLRAHDVDLRAVLSDTLGHDALRGRGRIDADLQSRGATADAVLAALNGNLTLHLQPAGISGVDLAQTLSGWRTASQARSDTVASDVARQTVFSQIGASFQLRDGVARSTDLDGRSNFLRLSGEGTVDLVRERLDYRLRARVVNTASGRAGPEMAMLNGVTVPVELVGPFGQIEWRVDWAPVTAAAGALSVPSLARGTVGGVARGATGVVRGAAGLLRGVLPGTEEAPATPLR